MRVYHTDADDADVECVCVCKNQIVDGIMKGEGQMTRTSSGHSMREFSEGGSNSIFSIPSPHDVKRSTFKRVKRTTHCLAKSSWLWKPFA